jgi:HEAT repeat protein
LYRISGDDEFLQLLITALETKHLPTRESAALSLGDIGPKAHAAVPALTALLEHPKRYVHQIAAEALKKIDPSAGGE